MRNSFLLIFLALAAGAQARELAFITNQNAQTVSIVDVRAREELKRVAVPGEAAGIAATAHRFYTVSPVDSTLREFTHQGELCRELRLKEGGGTIALSIDDARKRAYVSDMYGTEIFAVDLLAFAPIGTVKVGQTPAGLDLSDDGKTLAVAARDDNALALVDAENLTVLGHVATGQHPFGVTAYGGKFYTTDVMSNAVSVVDPGSMSVVQTVPTLERPYDIAFAGGMGFATDQYADAVTVFDPETGAVVKQIDVGEYPEGIAASGDQSEIYVANWFSNIVSVIDVKTLEMVDEIPVDDGPRAFGSFVAEEAQEGCDDPI